ncbi:hypothetical protein [Streptomyces sp. NPDC056056]|uniref:hypothetical protein n=1 Tax=Streptomyces sp. NPDC056056 TaxID=3345698 RepID=UPI0035E3B5EB
MQRYELDAWLGDNHGLTEDDLDTLLAEAAEIEERYPDPDDQAERDAALSVAYRLKVESAEDVLSDFSEQRSRARAAESAASAGLQQAAQTVIAGGLISEAAFARNVGVDRMTVRKWTQDQRDRALFDRALYLLLRRATSSTDQQKLNDAIAIRDTGAQAGVLLAALQVHSIETLGDEDRAVVQRAEKRARQIV